MGSTMQTFYLARAAESARHAEAATLANVRDRFRLSQQIWADLAERAGRVDTMRAKITAEKAEAALAG